MEGLPVREVFVSGVRLMKEEFRNGRAMQEFRVRMSGRPRPLPHGRWTLTERWNDLLIAHWAVSPAAVAGLLPECLQADIFDGAAWLGITPFWMDRIRVRGFPTLPGLNMLPVLNLRTYVRDQRNGVPGVYVFSIDTGNLFAVLMGRMGQHLPCHWADVQIQYNDEREVSFFSRRRLALNPAVFQARYRGLGPTRKTAENRSGSLEFFLMERNTLYTSTRSGQVLRSNLHSVSWPLEMAEAEIEQNTLGDRLGLHLPEQPTSLHYLRRMALYIWPAERVRARVAAQPVRVAVTPS
jgi:uncharacterized protein YqjF (DUF2071 family)